MTLFSGSVQRQNTYVRLSRAFAEVTQCFMAPIGVVFTLQSTYMNYFIERLSVH